MTEDRLTIHVLKQIRDEIVETRTALGSRLDLTNERLDQTNERLDQTNERLDETNERLDQTNLRLSAVEETLLELATQQRFVVRSVRGGRDRQGRLEGELASLRTRVDAIELRLDEPKPG
ncbi:MAG: hypothetical protein AAGF12_27410 [Myxococcota bacterium]